MIRLYPGGGWPRHSMRIHLMVLPSTFSTAMALGRFRVASGDLEGRPRSQARRRWLRSRKVGFGLMLRLSLQEVFERRPVMVALGALTAVWATGMALGGVARWLM